jgi:hypothetical protein
MSAEKYFQIRSNRGPILQLPQFFSVFLSACHATCVFSTLHRAADLARRCDSVHAIQYALQIYYFLDIPSLNYFFHLQGRLVFTQ